MSVTGTPAPVVLEPASQAFVEATAKPPFLYQLTPAEARKVLDDVQAAPIDKLPVQTARGGLLRLAVSTTVNLRILADRQSAKSRLEER